MIAIWLVMVAIRVRALARSGDRVRSVEKAGHPAWIVWLICAAVMIAFAWLLVESVRPDPEEDWFTGPVQGRFIVRVTTRRV